MNLLHSFIVPILLAVTASALLPSVSSLSHVGNLTTKSTYPSIRPSDAVYRYADLMNGLEPENRYSSLPAPATGWSGPDDMSKGSNTAVVRMSTVKQYVAEFQGQRLFDIIHDALLKLCPYERGRIGCYRGMPGSSVPYPDNYLPSDYKYYNKFYVLDVPYKTDKGDYASDAWLTITARAIFRNDKYPDIGAATYEMAAGVFKQATEASRGGVLLNCYTESFNKNSRPYQFCNVPNHVLVALPADNGKVTESWLSVTIKSSRNTKHGQFDCYSSMSSVIDFWGTAVLPDVAKSMGISESDWKTLCTECWNEDKCFDVEGWRTCHTCDYLGWV